MATQATVRVARRQHRARCHPSFFPPRSPPTPRSPARYMADHPHTIDRWDDATGENLIERIAAVSDYLVAVETYRAAVKRWPGAKITLRNRARVHRAELEGLAATAVDPR